MLAGYQQLARRGNKSSSFSLQGKKTSELQVMPLGPAGCLAKAGRFSPLDILPGWQFMCGIDEGGSSVLALTSANKLLKNFARGTAIQSVELATIPGSKTSFQDDLDKSLNFWVPCGSHIAYLKPNKCIIRDTAGG